MYAQFAKLQELERVKESLVLYKLCRKKLRLNLVFIRINKINANFAKLYIYSAISRYYRYYRVFDRLFNVC